MPLTIRSLLASLMAAGLVVIAAAPLHAQEGGIPHFTWPVACKLGQDCWLMQHLDHDSRPNVHRDFACGQLSYDDHTGTDIAVSDMSRIADGVPILAAAPGEVYFVRETIADPAYSKDGPPETAKRQQCGNAVVIDHGHGLRSHYCHLRWGSISVRQGQKVRQGDQIGLMGLTGLTSHPHLHFGLEMNKRSIDPMNGMFQYRMKPNDCTASTQGSLWETPVPYSRLSMINAGVSAGRPDIDSIRAGKGGSPAPNANSPAIVLWFDSFGTRPGDNYNFKLIGPDGKSVVFDIDQKQTKDYALYSAFSGIPRPPAGWGSGTYTALVSIIGRDGAKAGRRFTFEIR